MKERPILFSAPMVLALLNGSKTQTRRVLKNIEELDCEGPVGNELVGRDWPGNCVHVKCPYGQEGDRLWVKETFWRNTNMAGERIRYRADDLVRQIPEKELPIVNGKDVGIADGHCWTPSIFMPRWASRLTLEITSVRAERLNDITEEDALAEGISRDEEVIRAVNYRPISAYKTLWETINGTGSWEKNPWVWVISFRPSQPVAPA